MAFGQESQKTFTCGWEKRNEIRADFILVFFSLLSCEEGGGYPSFNHFIFFYFLFFLVRVVPQFWRCRYHMQSLPIKCRKKRCRRVITRRLKINPTTVILSQKNDKNSIHHFLSTHDYFHTMICYMRYALNHDLLYALNQPTLWLQVHPIWIDHNYIQILALITWCCTHAHPITHDAPLTSSSFLIHDVTVTSHVIWRWHHLVCHEGKGGMRVGVRRSLPLQSAPHAQTPSCHNPRNRRISNTRLPHPPPHPHVLNIRYAHWCKNRHQTFVGKDYSLWCLLFVFIWHSVAHNKRMNI